MSNKINIGDLERGTRTTQGPANEAFDHMCCSLAMNQELKPLGARLGRAGVTDQNVPAYDHQALSSNLEGVKERKGVSLSTG